MASRSTALRYLGRLLSLTLLVLAIFFLSRTIGDGRSRVGERLRHARPGPLALAVLMNAAGYAVWTTRWRLLLAPVARVPWWTALRALMASVFINTVVPFARSLGGLVRATYAGRSLGTSIAPLYGVTLVDQLGYSVMSVALGAFFVPLAAWGRTSGRGGTGVAIAVGAAVALALAAIAVRGRGAMVVGWVRRRMPGAGEAVESGVAAARRVLARRATWAIVPAGGAGLWLCNVLTFALAGRAVGVDMGFGAAAAAWSIGSIVGVASGTPGGIGTTESAAIVPLVAQGYAAPAALAAVLLARLIQYGSAITIGGVCFFRRGGAGLSTAAPKPPADPLRSGS